MTSLSAGASLPSLMVSTSATVLTLSSGPSPGNHFLDGDGMVHAVQLRNGCSSYACCFTKTEQLKQERTVGRLSSQKPSVSSTAIRASPAYSSSTPSIHPKTPPEILGLVDPSRGTGVANTSLVYFNNRLLAMSEDNLPYHVRINPDGDLENTRHFDFDGQLIST